MNTILEKIKMRRRRYDNEMRTRASAMPTIPRVVIANNYVNPITLNVPGMGVVYELVNRNTGRRDYFDKVTFFKLMKMIRSNYNLLMRNPKVPIPGVRNPMTRGPIYPRNVRRVTVVTKKKTPTKNAAARKIQSAVKKHLSKKRASPKKNVSRRVSK